MAGVKRFTVVAEALTADACFAAARQAAQQAGDVNDGIYTKNVYRLLDLTTLFPSDAAALARVEDFVAVQPQPAEANPHQILMPGSPLCYALQIKPLKEGRRRVLFFGLRRV